MMMSYSVIRQSFLRSGKLVRHCRSFHGSCSMLSEHYSSEAETHFGFKTVTEREKKEKVLGVFNNVAEKYDLMNDAMSFGIHRIWKNIFVSALNPSPGTRLLDVAGGTGDIAFRFLDHNPGDKSSHVTVCDINQNMLDVGAQRAKNLGYAPESISFIQGDAQDLSSFPDASFDAYTIAFGIRNVVKIDQALKEAYRVLRPGGRFLCLEFSHVDNPVLNPIYEAYSFNVIPPMGKVLAGDWDSYQYLVESIRKFPKQDDFSEMIRCAGFRLVRHTDLTLGVAAIHTGFKL